MQQIRLYLSGVGSDTRGPSLGKEIASGVCEKGVRVMLSNQEGLWWWIDQTMLKDKMPFHKRHPTLSWDFSCSAACAFTEYEQATRLSWGRQEMESTVK